jgi:hypothetical protein
MPIPHISFKTLMLVVASGVYLAVWYVWIRWALRDDWNWTAYKQKGE